MTIAGVLDVAYASLIEDFAPPLSRAAARIEVDKMIDGDQDDDEKSRAVGIDEWGTTPDSVAGQNAFRELSG